MAKHPPFGLDRLCALLCPPRRMGRRLLLLASALLWTCAAAAAEPESLPAGVRYAFDQVHAATESPISSRVGPGQLADASSPEAFALVPVGKGFRVEAHTYAGLMYGLLDLRDRISDGNPPKQRVVSFPALRVRGDTFDFPFYLGVDLYEGRWRHAAKIEHSPQSWWLDRGHWAWRLRRCAEQRVNALLLQHPHPFPALVDLPGMPGAAYLAPEHLKRVQDHFRWILDEAEAWGVRVYFLTWNIWVSPGFAKVHAIPQEGPEGDLARRYTRACYRRLFETYPKLAGVMTMAGEAPPGCVEFVRDAIVGGLNELPKPPELLYWTWCSYPEDAEGIFRDYRGKTSLVHYLQYEQFFRPQADPRIKRSSEALGGVPVITLGGLGTATGWLYWSDPYTLGAVMEDLPRQNGEGCFFQGLDSFEWVAKKWLGWEALARTMWSPPRREAGHAPGAPPVAREDAYWHGRIARTYGTEAVADDFLKASIAASSIPTRLLALLHRQTDHHMPQFGLPLACYLGLPTLSTYIFENHQSIDALGRLAPRLGLTYPNPDWGEKVIGVTDFVAGAHDGTTPLQIADELRRHAQTASECVARLRPLGDRVKEGSESWGKCLDQMQMNAHLGRHTAAKIRAAVAWERWNADRRDPGAVLEPLRESVAAMERMAEVAARLYPGLDIHTYRVGTSRPWPWTNLQIWNLDRWRRHQWRDSAAMFHRELEWVREELERGYPQPLLPFEDDLAPKPENARLLVRWDFEGDPPPGIRVHDFPPHARATLGGGEAPAPLAGPRLVAEHQQPEGFYFPITTDPGKLPLQIGKRYRVTADYWILESADHLGDWLSAGARTTEGGWRKDVGARYMGGPAGTRGRITLTFTPRTWKDYYVYLSLHGRSKVELDNLEVWEEGPGTRDPEGVSG